MDRIIDYPHLIQNIDEMINTLEYDSSRSGGKTKLNCDKLVNLYSLRERYSKVIEKKNSKYRTMGKKGKDRRESTEKKYSYRYIGSTSILKFYMLCGTFVAALWWGLAILLVTL